jgi:hypothetical protein
MKSSSPQIEHLKKMLNIEEKKAALQSQLDELNRQLDALKQRLLSGSPAASAPKAAGPGRSARNKRGELKSAIFSALEKAGSGGVKVLDLAKSLRTKPANVYAWFHAATKRYPGTIKKVGNAEYKLVGKAPELKAKPASNKGAKRAKKGTKRGALAAKILAALKASGSQGLTLKALSQALGQPYRNLQVWFATTGKNNPAIKKIAPATYVFAEKAAS